MNKKSNQEMTDLAEGSMMVLYKRLASYLKPYKWRFAFGIIFGALYGVVNGVMVLVINNVTNVVFGSSKSLDDFEKIITAKPEIIIIGTGKDSILPKTEVIRQIQIHDIGIEFMKTESACKTFNLLISEERNVAGAFLI